MDLFKPSNSTVATPSIEGRDVFIAIVDPEGDATIPDLPWCRFHRLEFFSDLVTPGTDPKTPLIVLCPDDQASALRIRLAIDNAGTCDINPIQVTNVSTYSPSSMSETVFWAVQRIDFNDWRLEVEEAVRSANLAERAATDADERRITDNARTSGSFKKVVADDGVAPATPLATDEPAEEDEEPPVF